MVPLPPDRQIWSMTLENLKGRLPSDEVGRWLEPLELYSRDGDGDWVLLAPNRFFVDWVQDNYLDMLTTSLAGVVSGPVKLNLTDDVEQTKAMPEINFSRIKQETEDRAAPVREKPAVEAIADRAAPSEERYTFETFVVGEFNRFAHAAALAVSGQPGQTYNPLFIYGGAGLGKTHLIKAIGHQILETRSPATVVYVSSEEFTNQMIQAIRNKTMDRFRDRFRNVDALLIDDIHFLGTKERTQEEFFFTFNALYNAGRQIILTSDQRPKDIPGLEERLRSRFEWGLIADIQMPDKETKIAIIQKKAEEEALTIPEDVALLLASTDETNIRVLEGFLNRLAAFSSLSGRPISVELARQALADSLADKEVSADDIMRLICERYNIRLVDLKSGKKEKKISEPRQIAMYLIRKMTDLPLIKIGQKLGGKDHSTVVHGVKRIEGRITKDFDFGQEMANLEKTVRLNG